MLQQMCLQGLSRARWRSLLQRQLQSPGRWRAEELGVAATQAFASFHFLTSRSSLLYLLTLLCRRRRRRQCDPKNPPCEDSPSCEVDVRQSCKVRIAAFLLDYDCAVVNDTSLSLTPPNPYINFHSIFAHSSERMQPGLPQSPLLLLGPSKLPCCSWRVSNISSGF